jgi:2-polyprenyl-6-hydroxyphenyl methylase/3-demethylubiquinone-9 3-methyltransferase
MSRHAAEVARGERFAFGENWRRFLARLDEGRIQDAERSLCAMLGVRDLAGRRFLDVGCGSGLFSLAARRLGAHVHAFDYDPASVACARELRRRYFPDDPAWVVETGSVLDREYLGALGRFDVVYAWGVLHHTGAMWEALDHVCALVERGGRLFLAIYNDQGVLSHGWRAVKWTYNRLPRPFRWLIVPPVFVAAWGPRLLADLRRGRPGESWREYGRQGRGMSPWHDLLDWVGGYPYEFAAPDAVVGFCARRGLTLRRLEPIGRGSGCNQFVLER